MAATVDNRLKMLKWHESMHTIFKRGWTSFSLKVAQLVEPTYDQSNHFTTFPPPPPQPQGKKTLKLKKKKIKKTNMRKKGELIPIRLLLTNGFNQSKKKKMPQDENYQTLRPIIKSYRIRAWPFSIQHQDLSLPIIILCDWRESK